MTTGAPAISFGTVRREPCRSIHRAAGEHGEVDGVPVKIASAKLGRGEPVHRGRPSVAMRRRATAGGRRNGSVGTALRRTKRLIRRFRRFRSAGALGFVRLNRGDGARGEVVDAAQNFAPAEQRGERPFVGKLERIVDPREVRGSIPRAGCL